MVGHIDDYGRAMIRILVQGEFSSEQHGVDFWIDTGFTGELVLPEKEVTQLRLAVVSEVTTQYGDGRKKIVPTHKLIIDGSGN